VVVLSHQKTTPFETVSSLNDVSRENWDYVVIASPTADHLQHLQFVEEHFNGIRVLVEKPIFDRYYEFEVKNNEVFVGYNLRLHPLVGKIKELLSGRHIWSAQVLCGSFLPDWRPDRDYRETTSAKKSKGGGALLDLSHELDYLQWFLGRIEVSYALATKVSDLDIDTEDLLLLSGIADKGAHVHVNLNYFYQKPLRQIVIEGEGISIRGDLVENKLSVIVDGNSNCYSWDNFSRSENFLAQHQAILARNDYNLCTFEQGMATMRLIRDIQHRCQF